MTAILEVCASSDKGIHSPANTAAVGAANLMSLLLGEVFSKIFEVM
jgi:hypothetical protein